MPEPATPYFLTDEEVRVIRLMLTAADMNVHISWARVSIAPLATTFGVSLSQPEEE